MIKSIYRLVWALSFFTLTLDCAAALAQGVTKYVNPLFGTTTLWDKEDLGYEMSENPIYRTVLTEQGRRPAQGKTRGWRDLSWCRDASRYGAGVARYLLGLGHRLSV